MEQAAKVAAQMRFMCPQGISAKNITDARVSIWTMMWALIYLTLLMCQEVYMIKALIRTNALRKEGIIDHSFFACFVLYGKDYQWNHIPKHG